MRTLLLLLPLLLSSTHSTSDAQCTTMQWQIFSDANCTTVDAQGSAKWNVWFTPAHVTEMADGCFSAEGNIFGHIHLACTQQNVTMVRGPGSCKPYRGHPPQTFTFEQGKCSHAFEAGAIVTYTMYTAPKQEQEHSAPRVGSATRRDDFPPTATAAAAVAGTETSPDVVHTHNVAHPGLVEHWDFGYFNRPTANALHGEVNGYVLRPNNASHAVAFTAVGGHRGVAFDGRQRLVAKRKTVPLLGGITGKDAEVTMIAWVRFETNLQHGAFIGGVWEESNSWRQYALFMDHTAKCPANNGIVAHISAEGGPSPGQRYCESAACGATALAPHAWHCIASTYDGVAVRAWVNGTLDNRSGPQGLDPRNPFLYPNPPTFPNGGIFEPPHGGGADFALGYNLIHSGGGVGPAEIGNAFVGVIGGIAIHNVSLGGEEILAICNGDLK